MMERMAEASPLFKARAAGVFWLMTFLSPPLAESLSPYIMIPGVLGELSLTLWLIIKGVNAQRWQEQASAAAKWRPSVPMYS